MTDVSDVHSLKAHCETDVIFPRSTDTSPEQNANEEIPNTFKEGKLRFVREGQEINA